LKKRFRLSEGSGKFLIALTLVSLLALPVFGLFLRHSTSADGSQHPRMQGKDFKSRAAAICTALGTSATVIGEPQFVVQTFRAETLRGQRRLWMVECQVGSRQYNLLFNDLTGNLESMYADGREITSRAGVEEVAVNSPSEAVEGSIRRLQDLQMVPKGTLITLVKRPTCDQDGLTWRLVWRVQRSKTAAPYEVSMMLNGCDAMPMMVVNRQELGTYARN